MPDRRRTRCRRCKRHRRDAGSISWRGLCRDCGLGAVASNVHDLEAHTGVGFDVWRLRMAASVGAIPLDLVDTYVQQRQSQD